ncbi:hypothetical protein OROHE_004896 [Orobanche hederae]
MPSDSAAAAASRGEYLDNEDETDELCFNYKPYIEENTSEPHQTYDEFVVPIDQLTDDEDEELGTAREMVRNYRSRLKGIPEEKLNGPIEVGIVGDNNCEPRIDDVGEGNVIDENIEYNETDDLWSYIVAVMNQPGPNIMIVGIMGVIIVIQMKNVKMLH